MTSRDSRVEYTKRMHRVFEYIDVHLDRQLELSELAGVAHFSPALLRDWLPSSGMQLDSRPCFEYYPRDAEYDAASGAFGCDIVIPVVPL